MDFLSLRDPAVQEFLWAHLVPRDIHHTFTKADALKHVHDQVMAGQAWLVGDMEAGLVFRCVLRNPLILECHIMGTATHLRSLLPAALEVAWSRKWDGERPIARIVIVTAINALIGILTRLGFAHEATHPRAHWNGDDLVALHILTLENPRA